jgi:polar amino acid transport system substrate-binding protein
MIKAMFALMLLLATACVQAEKMVVAADIWCPFNCQPNSPTPGYVVDILRAAFPQKTIEYRVLPWKRTLLEIRQHKVTAAISLTQQMAIDSQLKIGKEPIGADQDCLFVAATNPLKYHNQADDLNSLSRVSVVLGYDYDEGFGAWLARPANKYKIHVQSGDDPSLSNLLKLVGGRLDGVIESGAVMNNLLLDPRFAGKVISAGCNSSLPYYVGFAADEPQVDALLSQLDQAVVALRRSGELSTILARYGLKDWL